MDTHTHTPVPWTILPDSRGLSIWFSDGEIRSQIATLNDFDLCEEHGTIEANARLIAAAPELLAHLKMLVFGISEGVDIPRDGAAVNAARMAIAKAEGREEA